MDVLTVFLKHAILLMLYKDNSSLHNSNSFSKEGQQGSLYSTKADDCCPSLGTTPSFSKEAMNNFIELAKILKRIHIRMIMEGWGINKGRFIRPDGSEFNYED